MPRCALVVAFTPHSPFPKSSTLYRFHQSPTRSKQTMPHVYGLYDGSSSARPDVPASARAHFRVLELTAFEQHRGTEVLGLRQLLEVDALLVSSSTPLLSLLLDPAVSRFSLTLNIAADRFVYVAQAWRSR